jgi:hypothetical protein
MKNMMIKNGNIGIKKKIVYNTVEAVKPLPHIVQVKVEPNAKVEVQGKGITAVERIESNKKVKFAKFAKYNLKV